jgi:hypothetical protein
MKQPFSLTFRDAQGRETLDLVSMSDAMRRGAAFDRPKLAARFNREARNLCAAVQWLDLNEAAGWPGEKTRAALDSMQELARANGIKRVILPVYGDSYMGKLLGDQMGAEKHALFETQELVEKQDLAYITRYHSIGKVDGRRKTALDYKLAYVAE